MDKKVEITRDKKTEKECKSIRNIPVSKDKISSNWYAFTKAEGKCFERRQKSRDSINYESSKGVKKFKSHERSKITKVVSLDCEMVSDLDDKAMLGRVSIVNFKLECLYDKFVKPTSPVGDYRTRFSGLREDDLEMGEDFEIVQEEVKAMLRNRILVGHALHNDLKVLKIWHPKPLIRDTSNYSGFQGINEGKRPSLKSLAKAYLGENIQDGEHNSVEDAITVMKLYNKFRQEWEASLLKKQIVKKHHES